MNNDHPNRLWQPTTAKWFAAIFGGALAYAIVRYHLVGDVEWRHFPLFIFNKATSMAAVGFVACSYLVGKVFHWHDDDPVLRLVVIKFCGLMGFFLAVIHALMAGCLLGPAYFAKYFDEAGRMNLEGELAMCAGVLGLVFLSSPAIATIPMMAKEVGGWRWKRGQRLGYVALILIVAHLVFLGVEGWMAPSKWQGGLPPISLITVVIALIPIVVKRGLVQRQRAKGERL
jgi:DMSO/TMAO reductase YedYZ heme-binding membrane subunit